MTQQVNLIDSYKLYKTFTDKPVERKVYLEIVYGLMKFIVVKLLDGATVRLGARLGVVGVKGKHGKPIIDEHGEIKGIAPNWGKTKIIWEAAAKEKGMDFQEYIAKVPKEDRPRIAYCFNEHSNGIIHNFNWYKDKVVVANKSFYGLKFSWHNKRALSKLSLEGKEYDTSDNISTIKNFNPQKWTPQS